jgi:hypothetical protein
MKKTNILAALLVASTLVASFPSTASSIGRSSSSSASRSSSVSRPSAPPSRPSVAPAQRSGGIGGSSGSYGVRKSEVTNQVAQNKGYTAPPSATKPSGTAPTPNYQPQPTPNYGGGGFQSPAPNISNGSIFASSLGGSLLGSVIGNSLFGGHGGGTTVINNGATGSGSAVSGAVPGSAAADSNGSVTTYSQAYPPKKSYGMWDFITDVFLFVLLLATLAGAAFLIYKGYKMVRSYIQRERGVTKAQPINPGGKFWQIQNAFATADSTTLQTLISADLFAELGQNLTPSDMTLTQLSHEVVLDNATEFSVNYTFTDVDQEIDQVWHYELQNGVWMLVGIETLN